MNPGFKHFLLISLYFIDAFCVAQNREVDSIKRIMLAMPNDSTKVKTMNKLVAKNLYGGQYDSALKYLKAAKSLAEKIDFKRGVANSYNHYGMYYEFTGKYNEAIKSYQQSLDLYTKIDYKKGISNAYNNIGGVYYNQGNYPKSLECFLGALKLREAANDEVGISSSYNNIGEVYYFMENYDDALKNYFKSLKTAEKLNDEMQIATCYNNIGNVYTNRDQNKALDYYQKSLKIRTEIDDKQGMAASYANLGSVLQTQKKYKEALDYFSKGLAILNGMGEKSNLPTLLNNIADVYIKLNQPKKALPYVNEAIEIALQNNDKDDLKNSYGGLSEIEASNGNISKAFEHYKLYIAYRDSMENEENTKNLIKADMNFEFAKKEAATKLDQEKQKAVAAAESKRQQIVIWSICGILFLVICFALFVFRSNRQKHKANIEISNQKEIIEEKQKEIIDSITYAKYIQAAIMATEEDIKKHFPESFLFYKPKDIVAGDFYFFEETKDHYFVAAADCTGHGVPGALVSMVCSNALIRSVKEFNLVEPGKVLDKTKELIIETFKKSGQNIQDGMDISFCAIKKNGKEKVNLKWAGAHNPLLLIRNEGELKLEEIKADKMPVGQSEINLPFKTHETQLNKGDMFVLLTDGFSDQFGGTEGKKFKYKHLQQLVVSNSHLSLEEQKQKLSEAFDAWKGDLDQIDDICIIGVRV